MQSSIPNNIEKNNIILKENTYKTNLKEENQEKDITIEQLQQQRKKSFTRKDSAHLHKSDGNRWLILVLASFSQLGGCICINFPAYMQLQLEQLFKIDDTQYNILFSSISLPNIILPFIIGYLTSKVIGARIAFNMCIFFIFLGQFLTLLAVKMEQFELMIFGRFLLGVGYTNAYVPRQQIITKWFYGKELGFSLTSFLIVGKAGVVFSAYVFGRYQQYQPNMMYIPITFTCIICLCSFLSAKIMTMLDEKYDVEQEQYLLMMDEENTRRTSGGMEDRDEVGSEQKVDDSILSQSESSNDKALVDSQNNEVNDEVDNHKNNIINTIKGFNCVYWLLVAVFTIDIIMFFQTQDNNQQIMKQRNNLTGQITVYIFLVPSLLQSITSPLFALIMDKFGKRASVLVFSSVMGLMCFIVFLTNPLKGIVSEEVQAFLPFFLLGVFQCLVSGVKWPAISLLIPQEDLSLAVGIILSIFNLSQFICPIVAGQLLSQSDEGFSNLFIAMIALASLALFISITIYILDRDRNNSKLNKVFQHPKKQSIHINNNQENGSFNKNINNNSNNNNRKQEMQIISLNQSKQNSNNVSFVSNQNQHSKNNSNNVSFVGNNSKQK